MDRWEKLRGFLDVYEVTLGAEGARAMTDRERGQIDGGKLAVQAVRRAMDRYEDEEIQERLVESAHVEHDQAPH